MSSDAIEHCEDIIVDRPIPRDTLRSVKRGVLVTCTDTHCDWQGLFHDADFAATAVERHYDHEKRSGGYHYGSRTYLAVELLDQETRSSGLPTWTVVYVDEDVDIVDANRSDYYWQNELVARDGDLHRSFGRNPLAAPAFDIVGETDHQADFSEFDARADGGKPRSVDTANSQEEGR